METKTHFPVWSLDGVYILLNLFFWLSIDIFFAFIVAWIKDTLFFFNYLNQGYILRNKNDLFNISSVHIVFFGSLVRNIFIIYLYTFLGCCHQTFYYALWVFLFWMCHFLNQWSKIFSNSPIFVFDCRLNLKINF